MVRWTEGALRGCVSVAQSRSLFCPVYCSKLGSQMRIAGRVSKQFLQRLMLGWVAIVCAMPVIAQSPAAAPSTTSNLSANNSAAAGIQGVINLTGPWRFQIGDDPRWADPSFDDSSWPVVTLDEPLTGQGVEPYSGFAWYRIRLEPRQLAEFDNLSTNTP